MIVRTLSLLAVVVLVSARVGAAWGAAQETSPSALHFKHEKYKGPTRENDALSVRETWYCQDETRIEAARIRFTVRSGEGFSSQRCPASVRLYRWSGSKRAREAI